MGVALDAPDRGPMPGESPRPDAERMQTGDQIDPPVGDALVLEHQHPGTAGVRAVDDVQAGVGGRHRHLSSLTRIVTSIAQPGPGSRSVGAAEMTCRAGSIGGWIGAAVRSATWSFLTASRSLGLCEGARRGGSARHHHPRWLARIPGGATPTQS
jgi:hypothetical protein